MATYLGLACVFLRRTASLAKPPRNANQESNADINKTGWKHVEIVHLRLRLFLPRSQSLLRHTASDSAQVIIRLLSNLVVRICLQTVLKIFAVLDTTAAVLPPVSMAVKERAEGWPFV